MISMEQKYSLLFSLLKKEIADKEMPVDLVLITPAEYEKIYKTSYSHDLSHIVGKALLTLGADMPEEIKKAFQKSVSIAMYRYMQLSRELLTLSSALEDGMIPFIPLKGSIMRNYYDEPWMRTSCDIDVFVSDKDVDKAVKLLTEDYGYTFKERSPHDVSLYSEAGIHVELHFDLIEGEKTRSILNNVWKHSKKADGFEYKYEMSTELFVAYHIAHMAKHFETGGCGIRPLLDLWIINQKMKYDQKIVNDMLTECQLCKFYKEATLLSEIWFSNKEHTPLTLKMQDFIINAGSYGTIENRVAIGNRRRGGKLGYVFRRLFLPYSLLKAYYPRLEKFPILFPYYQFKRWVNFIFKKNKKLAFSELKYNQSVSNERKKDLHALISDLELM